MNRNEQRCSVCGAVGCYAKGLCRSCYNKARRREGNTDDYMTKVRRRWIGQSANGWTVIEHLPKDKVLCKCSYCGRTKIISKDSIANQSARPCVCHIERLVPKTATQARVYSAVMKHKGSGSKAAKELGLSRQAVFSVLETMRKESNGKV